MMDTMIWAILKMVVVLGGVCLALFFLGRLLKRNGAKKDGSFDSEIRLLATRSIAPQKYISLVEIGGQVLALGVSEAQITLLTKIENKEFAEKMMDSHRARPEPLSLFNYFRPVSPKPKWPRMGLLRRLHGR
jgi:flagellar biogenesis protein FliO